MRIDRPARLRLACGAAALIPVLAAATAAAAQTSAAASVGVGVRLVEPMGVAHAADLGLKSVSASGASEARFTPAAFVITGPGGQTVSVDSSSRVVLRSADGAGAVAAQLSTRTTPAGPAASPLPAAGQVELTGQAEIGPDLADDLYRGEVSVVVNVN